MKIDFKPVVTLVAISCAVSAADDPNNDCPLPDLLSGFPSFDQSDPPLFPICDPGTFCTLHFEEGSVSYNGNTSGSLAFYNVSDAYCLLNSTSDERECQAGEWINEVIFERVATEDFLQVWNIVLIVIGVLAFVVGDAVAAGLGTALAVKSVSCTDRVLAITMIVVSVTIVLPVAGPVALIVYLIMKDHSRDREMRWWYRMLGVFGIALKVVGALLWLVQAGYSATQDFYGEGPLRGKNGECIPHEANKTEMRVQDVLVILSHVVSIVMAIDLHIKAFVSKLGTKKSGDATDSGGHKTHEMSKFG